MNKIFLIVVVFMIAGCNSAENSTKTSESAQFQKEPVSKAPRKADILTIDTTGFLNDCKHLGRYIGAIQGTNSTKDSTGFMCFMTYYTCPKTYEIVCAHKGGIKKRNDLDFVRRDLDDGCDNGFANFDAFAFVLPLVDPDKQEDMHALNVTFPVHVKVYKQVDVDRWHLLKDVKVNSFEEYGMLQFKTVYGL